MFKEGRISRDGPNLDGEMDMGEEEVEEEEEEEETKKKRKRKN